MPPPFSFYCSNDRLLAFYWLFGIEAPVACAFMAYLYNSVFADAFCPATQVGRMSWILQRVFLTIVPSFAYLWGAMRAFDTDTKAEDPWAGVESMRWQKFQRILSNNTEQTMMFVPVIVSLTMLLPCETWAAVPTLLCSFVIGRLLFGAGYFIPTFPKNRFAPLFTLNGWGRSPGMNLTLYPTNFALCLCAYYLYTGEGACKAGEKWAPAPARHLQGGSALGASLTAPLLQGRGGACGLLLEASMNTAHCFHLQARPRGQEDAGRLLRDTFHHDAHRVSTKAPIACFAWRITFFQQGSTHCSLRASSRECPCDKING